MSNYLPVLYEDHLPVVFTFLIQQLAVAVVLADGWGLMRGVA